MASKPPDSLSTYLRTNLGRMVDARGSRKDVAEQLDMHPSQLTRIILGDTGWATLDKLEDRLRGGGLDPMEMLGPTPALMHSLPARDMYLIGRLLLLIRGMEPERRQKWLQNWVDAAELATDVVAPDGE